MFKQRAISALTLASFAALLFSTEQVAANESSQSDLHLDLGGKLVLERKYKKAAKYLLPSARSGDPVSQYFMGQIIEFGGPLILIDGVQSLDPNAQKVLYGKMPETLYWWWYREAAMQHLPSAQSKLCHLYRIGKSVTQDYEKARKWCELAANAGDPNAEYDLGLMTLRGEGIKKDRGLARGRLNKATGDVIEAQGHLSRLNLNPGKRDGIFGKKTAVAVGNFQKLSGLRRDGEINRLTLNLLRTANRNQKKCLKKKSYSKCKKPLEWKLTKDQQSEIIRISLGSVGISEQGKIKADEDIAQTEKRLNAGPRDKPKDISSLKEYIAGLGEREKKEILKILQARSERDVAEASARLEAQKEKKYANIDFGNYHALIIGNNKYKNLQKLNTPVNDATVIGALLKNKYGFTVKILSNGSRAQIVRALNHFKKTLRKKDNFLIYYAGHGKYVEEINKGYWQPIDAEVDEDTNWIPNYGVTDRISGMKARHVIVVADSCYSGTVFRGIKKIKPGVLPNITFLKQTIEKKSRVALASGGNEPVADAISGHKHSVFAQIFINILKKNNVALSAARLSEDLREKVITTMKSYQIEQTPQYSHLYRAGHDGGDFVFIPRRLVSRQ